MQKSADILRFRALKRVRNCGGELDDYLQQGALRLWQYARIYPPKLRESFCKWLVCQMPSDDLFKVRTRSECIEPIPFSERRYIQDNLPLWSIAYLVLACGKGIDFSQYSRTIRNNRSEVEILLMRDIANDERIREFLNLPTIRKDITRLKAESAFT